MQPVMSPWQLQLHKQTSKNTYLLYFFRRLEIVDIALPGTYDRYLLTAAVKENLNT